MRIVGRNLLYAFCIEHADCRKWISNWIRDAEQATWKDSHAIKATYPRASFVAGNRVIFDVKGNDYRLETQVAYSTSVVSIQWVGTHAEYTKRLR